MDSFYFNGRLKFAIIPKRLDKKFSYMVNMLQFWPNLNGVEVRSLLIDVYADPGCSTACYFIVSIFAMSWEFLLATRRLDVYETNTVVSYQNESFSSKCLACPHPPSSYEGGRDQVGSSHFWWKALILIGHYGINVVRNWKLISASPILKSKLKSQKYTDNR